MSEPTSIGVTNSSQALAYIRGVVGAIIGGAAGFGLCWFLVKNMGLYAVAMPGAFLGLGCGTLSRIRSIPLGIVCMLAGFALGIVMEWCLFPATVDSVDESLSSFLQNLHNLYNPQRTWLFVGLGTLFAGWFGLGRERMQIMVEKSS